MQIHTTKDYGKYQGIKILIYGKSGVGKTTLIKTAPAPLIISTEGRMISLSGVNIPYINVTNEKDLEDVLIYLTTSPDMQNIHTLCVDSITDIAERILSSYKSQVKDARQAYGQLFDTVSNFVKNINDKLSCNVYWIAQQDTFIDDTGKTTFIPAMPGKSLEQWLPYAFDERFVFKVYINPETGEEVRYIQTKNDSQHDLKESSGKLPAYCRANLTEIFNMINA